MAATATPRSVSRGKVSAAETEFRGALDTLTQRITDQIAAIRIEIGALETRLESSISTTHQEVKALRELAILQTGQIRELRNSLSETRTIAERALHLAVHHSHRYPDGHTGLPYEDHRPGMTPWNTGGRS